MKIKSVAIGFLILSELVYCGKEQKKKPLDSNAQYEKLRPYINQYIAAQEKNGGFGGEMYCEHTLMGGDDRELYLTVLCTEYYQTHGDSIKVGTSSHSPAVIEYHDTVMVKVSWPRQGAYYSSDIKSMFPKPIAQQLLNDGNMAELYSKMNSKLQRIQKEKQKDLDRNLGLFREILLGNKHADFYGGGAEPFWTLYIIENQILFMNSMQHLFSYSLKKPFMPMEPNQIFKADNDVDSMRIEIIKQPTFEELSAQTYPFAVQLTWKEQKFSGIGNTTPLSKID